MSNEQLAEELHKPNIKKFKKRKLQSPFASEMQLISKVYEGYSFFIIYY